MTTKLFEIRDEGTCIPAIAICVDAQAATDEACRWLIRRSGWGPTQRGIYLLHMACENRCCYDCYSWADRTMKTAHHYIEQHFDQLANGSVIDVRFILGETLQPAPSDRFGEMELQL